MAWRVARSLDVLLGQLNSLAPQRSKASDGGIGDAEHASRSSDHNPWVGPAPDGKMLVTARDFTHDPAGGLDCNWLADTLIASGDRRIKYIIWNRRIWAGSWRVYTGINQHTHHLHLSVVSFPICDDPTPWSLGVEGDLNTAQDAALSQTWGTVVDGRNWQGSNLQRQFGFVVAQIQAVGAAVAAAASGGQLDADELAARLEAVTAEAAERAVVTAVLPALREVLADALGEDNLAQADAIVDRLAERLRPVA